MTTRAFGEVRETPEYGDRAKKVQYLDLNSTATIRFLTRDYVSVSTHWINRVSVKCLGDECPICANNRDIILRNPDTFRDDPKYLPRRLVNLANVMDRTPTRVCPNCQTEVRATASVTAACPKCGTMLSGNAAPLNKLKVLSRGVTLFDQLTSINNAVLDNSGEPVGLTKYDITLVVSGTGKSKIITPIAGSITDELVVLPENMYDTEKITLELSPSEMLDLQAGVSLKDIFAARRAAKVVLESAPVEALSELDLDKVNEDVEKLFGRH